MTVVLPTRSQVPGALNPCAIPPAPYAPSKCRDPEKYLRHTAPKMRHTLSYTTYSCARPIEAAAHTSSDIRRSFCGFTDRWYCNVSAGEQPSGERVGMGLDTSEGHVAATASGNASCTEFDRLACSQASASEDVVMGVWVRLVQVPTYHGVTR
jgi:hypothetical protein